MSPSQIEELLAIGWFLLASQTDENLLKIPCAAFGIWSLVLAALHAVASFTP